MLFSWINTSVDMLSCLRCEAALCVLINPKLTKRESIKKLVKAFQAKLATNHKKSCPFRLDAELHLLQNTRNKNESVVPPHLATVLSQGFLELVEHPSPLDLLKDRFNTIAKAILKDEPEPKDGDPPMWQFPSIDLPDDVMKFGAVEDDEHVERKRMLARLSDDETNQTVETLPSRLEEILRPRGEEDKIRAQTRAQHAWEALYEGSAALALFGWMPRQDNRCGSSTSDGGALSLQCSVCLSVLNIKLQEYDRHHSPVKEKVHDEYSGEGHNSGETPQKKRRRLNELGEEASTGLRPKAVQPLLAHRCYCPFVCGFPRDGERKGTPMWQTIASKVFEKHIETTTTESDDNNDVGDSAMDRILQLLQSSVSSYSTTTRRTETLEL
jgi:hypothetical protein